jgi:hypothetical protein
LTAGEQPTQVLGEHGEPCRGCGAPLAADQRYCLNCGQRRGEPRVAYGEHLGATNGTGPRAPERAPEAGAGAAEVGAGGSQRDYGPLAAVGGIAVLGLMLLVGVLIGKGSGEETGTTAPSVIRVEGGAGATASEDTGQSGALKRASGKSKKGGGILAGGRGGTGEPAVVAGDEDLQALQKQSPEDYQRASARLPDTIATGGKPPPTDNKAPGGGSGGGAVIK